MEEIDSKQTIARSDEVSLKELIYKIRQWGKYLKTKWVTIVIVSFLGATAGLAYSIFKKPIYTAELSFAVEDDKQSSMGGLGAAAGLASQFGVDLGGAGKDGVFSGDNLLQLMKSRSMVETTLLTPVPIKGAEQTLANLYIEFNNYRNKWADEPGVGEITFSPYAIRSKFSIKQDSVLGVIYRDIIKSNLSVNKNDKKLSIITVTLSSKNELFSKYFVEVLTKTVSDFYIATKTKKSVQNVNILQRQTDSVRRELNAAITGVAASADFNPNANPALQILRTPSQRRQVDVQANQAILTQLVTNLELSKISLRKETPFIQIVDRPILPLEKNKPLKLVSVLIGGIAGAILAIGYIFLVKIYQHIMNN